MAVKTLFLVSSILAVIGASAVARWAARKGVPAGSWLGRMLARKPPMLVRVALANKMARIVWALLAKGGVIGLRPRRRKRVTTASPSRRGRVKGEGWRTVERRDLENQLRRQRFKRVGLTWT